MLKRFYEVVGLFFLMPLLLMAMVVSIALFPFRYIITGKSDFEDLVVKVLEMAGKI